MQKARDPAQAFEAELRRRKQRTARVEQQAEKSHARAARLAERLAAARAKMAAKAARAAERRSERAAREARAAEAVKRRAAAVVDRANSKLTKGLQREQQLAVRLQVATAKAAAKAAASGRAQLVRAGRGTLKLVLPSLPQLAHAAAVRAACSGAPLSLTAVQLKLQGHGVTTIRKPVRHKCVHMRLSGLHTLSRRF